MKKWRHHALNNCVGIGELSIALYYGGITECLLTPHPVSLSPYEREREEVLERVSPLSYLHLP
jgi:hypothetical protein